MTSGSVKYVAGAPPGPKLRDGFVIVLGGAAAVKLQDGVMLQDGVT
jgi:hypothetical protein